MGKTVEQPVSAIYFSEQSGVMAKGLGARIRDQGAMVRLIWSHLFRGPEDMVEGARAVVIEEGCPSCIKIAKCYASFAHDCEIHFVDRDGKFIDEPDYIKEALRANTALPGQAFVDPKAALANLKSASQATQAEPLPEPESEVEDEPTFAVDELSEDSEPEIADDYDAGDPEQDTGSESFGGVHSEEVSLEDDRN